MMAERADSERNGGWEKNEPVRTDTAEGKASGECVLGQGGRVRPARCRGALKQRAKAEKAGRAGHEGEKRIPRERNRRCRSLGRPRPKQPDRCPVTRAQSNLRNSSGVRFASRTIARNNVLLWYASVNRHDGSRVRRRMNQDQVTSLLPVLHESRAFEGMDHLSRSKGWEARHRLGGL